ncbi:MAG: flagellar hook-length control protein FliK [Betaproteobacteria bacterium]
MNLLPSLNAQPALPAAARPTTPATPARGGPGFAQALGRAREGTPTARDDAAAAGRNDAAIPEESRGPRAEDPQGDGTGEAATAPATPADAADAATTRARPGAGGPGLDEAARGGGTSLDAAAVEAALASAEAAAGGAPFDGASRGTPALPAPGRGSTGPRGTALAAEQLRAGAAADPSSGAAPEAAGTATHGGFTVALRSASVAGTGAGAESAASAASPALAGAPATGALGSPSPLPPAPAAAPPAEAAVAARPGSPAFAGELSARLVTFVREGVEHGRLHLNPAEMGPVEVRIRIDGDAARVVLAADQAPTRQWLEQALPALAAGLCEAGLTLAGGGVFERGAGGGDGGRAPEGGRGNGRGNADAGLEAGLEPAAVREPALPRRRGVVDLVA